MNNKSIFPLSPKSKNDTDIIFVYSSNEYISLFEYVLLISPLKLSSYNIF